MILLLNRMFTEQESVHLPSKRILRKIDIIKKSKIKKTNFVFVFLIVSITFLMLSSPSVSAVSYIFSSAVQLTTATNTAQKPQILVDGSNVYVVWLDNQGGATNQLLYERSTDGGATFNGGTTSTPGTPVVLSTGLSGAANTPHIAVSGTHVYVTWIQGTTTTVYFTNSTDSGTTFNGGTSSSPGQAVALSDGLSAANAPQIVASGSNVIVTWQQGSTTEIYYSRSADSGLTFNGGTTHTPGTQINLSNTPSTASSSPQIAVSGSNIFIVWLESTTKIDYEKSTDGGATFNGGTTSTPGTPANLRQAITGSTVSSPQIATSLTNVVAIWRESTSSGHIFCVNSTDSGTTFNGGNQTGPGIAGVSVDITTSAISGSATVPLIAMSNSHVYVVWQQGTTPDIYYTNSTDGGITFNGGTTHSPGTPTNLSSNTGASQSAQLSTSGSNVYVVWTDKTADTNGDIYFSFSNDNGLTFNGATRGAGNPTPISVASTASVVEDTAAVSSSGTVIHTVWRVGPSPGAIDYTRSSTIPASTAFDASQYKQSNTATITVNSDASNVNINAIEQIVATVTSTSDSGGISVTLTETGVNTGIFTGQMTFTSGTSSGTALRANPGDTITASFGGSTGTASIFTRTIAFGFTTYTLSSSAIITVTDQNSNTDTSSVETIPITVSSTTHPSGISLTLTETGANTGIFKNTDLVFTTGNAEFTLTSIATLSQHETAGGQTTNNMVDTLPVQATSTSDPVGRTITLIETGPDTGDFSGELSFTNDASNGNKLKVADGDIIGVTYLGETANGIITPNSHAGRGALPASIGDTITASYGGATGTATIFPGSGGGGGGGGLVRPGLVLDVAAALAHDASANVSPSLGLSSLASSPGALPEEIRQEVLNQDPLKPIPPSHDTSFDFPFSIGDNSYPLAGYTNTISPNTVKTGDPVSVKLNIPATGLEHLALYTNIRGTDRDIYHSDTYIIYDKGQPLQIVDPHGYFAHVDFDLSTSGINNKVSYKIIFAKPMEKSDIDLRVWNDRKSTSDTNILDAWQVEPQSQTSQSQTAPLVTEPVENTKSDQNIPVTPPQTTQNENSVDILPAIKEWGGYSPNSISDSDLLKSVGISDAHIIPPWFMNTSKWVVDGEMSQQEFVDAIKYMHDKGIIK